MGEVTGGGAGGDGGFGDVGTGFVSGSCYG